MEECINREGRVRRKNEEREDKGKEAREGEGS